MSEAAKIWAAACIASLVITGCVDAYCLARYKNMLAHVVDDTPLGPIWSWRQALHDCRATLALGLLGLIWLTAA